MDPNSSGQRQNVKFIITLLYYRTHTNHQCVTVLFIQTTHSHTHTDTFTCIEKDFAPFVIYFIDWTWQCVKTVHLLCKKYLYCPESSTTIFIYCWGHAAVTLSNSRCKIILKERIFFTCLSAWWMDFLMAKFLLVSSMFFKSFLFGFFFSR